MQLIGPVVSALDPHDVALVQIPQSPRRCLRLPHHLTFDVRQRELCLVLGYQARQKCWEFDRVRHSVRPQPFFVSRSRIGHCRRPFHVEADPNATETRWTANARCREVERDQRWGCVCITQWCSTAGRDCNRISSEERRTKMHELPSNLVAGCADLNLYPLRQPQRLEL